jgi:hypothetical protein
MVARYDTCRRIYGNMDFLGTVVLTRPFRGKGRFSDREKVHTLSRFLDDENHRACVQDGCSWRRPHSSAGHSLAFVKQLWGKNLG